MAGIVTDGGTGAPVEGATVRLAAPSGSVREAITGPEGTFAFEGVTPGPYVLGARHLGYEDLPTSLEIGADGVTSLDIRLTPRAIPLEPLEVDIEGRPLRLVETGFYDRMEEGWGTYFERDWIEANAAGYTTLDHFVSSLQLRSPLSRCPSLQVYFDRRLIGTTSGWGTSRPYSINPAGLDRPRDEPPPTLLEELSVSDLGAAELYTPHSKLPFFAWNAATMYCGAIILWSDWIVQLAEVPEIEVELCEHAGRLGEVVLEGFVEDEITDVRLPAAYVMASYAAPDGLDRQQVEVRTDSLGRYRVCDLPSGAEVELMATYGPQSGVPTVFDAAAPDDATGPDVSLTVPVTSPGAISGVVITEGTSEPIRTARVTLIDTEFRAVTDQDGRFSLEELPPGRYLVRAQCRGFTGPVREVQLTEGANAAVVITLRRIGSAARGRCSP
ncbi:carboxypeptidase-like regulatory domain-containing protein [Candidatus Palauibacter sp.]|uniref:carboxypeptidase-like regulatory domain-containing protein n=1 Tax=Candidatus Palauibacter sp. TaxID=3101350 RepID=UPI003AF31255